MGMWDWRGKRAGGGAFQESQQFGGWLGTGRGTEAELWVSRFRLPGGVPLGETGDTGYGVTERRHSV